MKEIQKELSKFIVNLVLNIVKTGWIPGESIVLVGCVVASSLGPHPRYIGPPGL